MSLELPNSSFSNEKRKKVVVIAGGGVYGIIPCCFLKNIEAEMLEKVDVFGGTSVGGILALHLACNLDSNLLYEDFKSSVKSFFKRKFLNRVSFWHPKYDSSGIEAGLKRILPGGVFSCKRKFVVPCLDFKNVTPVIFHNFNNDYSHMDLWKIARSTSAAPMFFPPYSENILIDGGILENLPVITTASVIGKYNGITPSEIDVLAIGTGKIDQDSDKSLFGVGHYTKIDWARFLMPTLTTGGNEMMSNLWGENMGFNSFRLFNPITTDGIADNLDAIDSVEEQCELYYGKFKSVFKSFIED